MYGHLCKFFRWPMKRTPTSRKIRVWLKLLRWPPAFFTISISHGHKLLLLPEATEEGCELTAQVMHYLPQCSPDIWETRTSLTHHASLTHLNITRHHIVSLPFLYFCRLCSILLSVQTGSGELGRLSNNTRAEMLVSFSGRHTQILQVVP